MFQNFEQAEQFLMLFPHLAEQNDTEWLHKESYTLIISLSDECFVEGCNH